MLNTLPPVVKISTCNLNQHALDFTGNYNRIVESCLQSKSLQSKYRLGPELEITGYGCEDHFLESDTYRHAWQSLAKLLQHPEVTTDLLCDFGMPILHRGVRYNCRVYCLNGQIVLIRPKLYMANDGNYREHRYFTPWHLERNNEIYNMPPIIKNVNGQQSCPFGFYAIETNDGITIASETCEELFTPNSPHIHLGLNGIDIVTNGSGSHHELRKLHTRVRLMQAATEKSGGIYVYSNQQGCDGGRLYYDGCAMILVNGNVVAQGSQFDVRDVEVITANVDIDAVRSRRSSMSSRSKQASVAKPIDRIVLSQFNMVDSCITLLPPTPPLPHLKSDGTPGAPKYHTPEEEIALGPSCWLWDYLRRSGATGFFLPLSGGADSASTCALVGIMCQSVYNARNDPNTLLDLRRIMGHTKERKKDLNNQLVVLNQQLNQNNGTGKEQGNGNGTGNGTDTTAITKMIEKVQLLFNNIDVNWIPSSPFEISNQIMHTAYLGTKNSGNETRSRAAQIAKEMNTFHLDCNIDAIVDGLLQSYETSIRSIESSVMGGLPNDVMPNFKTNNGHWMEDLALQNIQARGRMIFSYMLAQLLPTPKIRNTSGYLLVLGSANVDEALRGYYTKYDCSAADINPIGGICKEDLKKFLIHAGTTYSWNALLETANAIPTAELRPPSETNGEIVQNDEDDMGMTYSELTSFGYHRKVLQQGAFSMTRSLIHKWNHLKPRDVMNKVKYFHTQHYRNRHKMTTLTPSYHAEQYSPDDNRFDLRPFLYPRSTHHQDHDLEHLVELIEKSVEHAKDQESKDAKL